MSRFTFLRCGTRMRFACTGGPHPHVLALLLLVLWYKDHQDMRFACTGGPDPHVLALQCTGTNGTSQSDRCLFLQSPVVYTVCLVYVFVNGMNTGIEGFFVAFACTWTH